LIIEVAMTHRSERGVMQEPRTESSATASGAEPQKERRHCERDDENAPRHVHLQRQTERHADQPRLATVSPK
jgi:hypothetical protein